MKKGHPPKSATTAQMWADMQNLVFELDKMDHEQNGDLIREIAKRNNLKRGWD